MVNRGASRGVPPQPTSLARSPREFTVLIRALLPEDAEAFHALRLEGLRDFSSSFASSFEEERTVSIAEVAERLAPSPGRAVFGAFVEDDLVGIVGLHREPKRKLAHKAFLWGVYVAPSHRRRGLARGLMTHAIEEASRWPGLQQINLGVNAANDGARTLYESLGFRTFGTERGFMRVDGVLQDELHMVRLLTAADA